MPECQLCGNEAGVQPEGATIRFCEACRLKMNTYYAFICGGCSSVYWLPKAPANVVFVAEHEGIHPLEAGKIGIIQMPSCKFCHVQEARHATVH